MCVVFLLELVYSKALVSVSFKSSFLTPLSSTGGIKTFKNFIQFPTNQPAPQSLVQFSSEAKPPPPLLCP